MHVLIVSLFLVYVLLGCFSLVHVILVCFLLVRVMTTSFSLRFANSSFVCPRFTGLLLSFHALLVCFLWVRLLTVCFLLVHVLLVGKITKYRLAQREGIFNEVLANSFEFYWFLKV